MVYGHQVETHAALTPVRIFTQQNFRSAGQARLLARPQRCGGLGKIAPCLHFDKDGEAIPFHDGIDFAGGGADAAANNGEAVAGKRGTGQLFRGEASGEVRHARYMRGEC